MASVEMAVVPHGVGHNRSRVRVCVCVRVWVRFINIHQFNNCVNINNQAKLTTATMPAPDC